MTFALISNYFLLSFIGSDVACVVLYLADLDAFLITVESPRVLHLSKLCLHIHYLLILVEIV